MDFIDFSACRSKPPLPADMQGRVDLKSRHLILAALDRCLTGVDRLALPGRATAEVAFLLGFSELSAFYRAFKRWTGTTPAAHRVSTGQSQTD